MTNLMFIVVSILLIITTAKLTILGMKTTCKIKSDEDNDGCTII